MFKLFRKPVPVDAGYAEDAYSTARDYHGFSTHLRHGNSREALCGIKILDGGSVITSEELVSHLPRQHASFYYCTSCASQLTGLTAEEIRFGR